MLIVIWSQVLCSKISLPTRCVTMAKFLDLTESLFPHLEKTIPTAPSYCFLAALIFSRHKQLNGERGISAQGTVHHSREIKAIGACSSWSPRICKQKADERMLTLAQHVFPTQYSPGSTAQEMVSPTINRSLLTSINIIKVMPIGMSKGLSPRGP